MDLWGAMTDFLHDADRRIKSKRLIKNYRLIIKQMVCYRKRLRNPINLKNGRPLAKSTINGFETRLDYLKQDADAYRAAIRLLIMCGYFKGKEQVGDLSTEKKLIRWMLRDYVRDQKELSELKKKNRDRERLRNLVNSEAARYWAQYAHYLMGALSVYGRPSESIFEEWSETITKCASDEMMQIHMEARRKIQKKNRKTYKEINRSQKTQVFKLIPGGKPFEDDPPFAPQNPS